MFQVVATIGSEIYVHVHGEATLRRLTAGELRTLQAEMNEWIPADDHVRPARSIRDLA